MEGWKQYLLSVIGCAFACGMVSLIVLDPKRKELMRLVCGMVLAISVIRPLSGIRPEDFLKFPTESWTTADPYIAEGERAAWREQERCIKESCQAYILDKARALGAEVSVEIFLDDDLLPAFAEITAEADPRMESQLQEILATGLGIPKEHQKWNRKPENNA